MGIFSHFPRRCRRRLSARCCFLCGAFFAHVSILHPEFNQSSSVLSCTSSSLSTQQKRGRANFMQMKIYLIFFVAHRVALSVDERATFEPSWTVFELVLLLLTWRWLLWWLFKSFRSSLALRIEKKPEKTGVIETRNKLKNFSRFQVLRIFHRKTFPFSSLHFFCELQEKFQSRVVESCFSRHILSVERSNFMFL